MAGPRSTKRKRPELKRWPDLVSMKTKKKETRGRGIGEYASDMLHKIVAQNKFGIAPYRNRKSPGK